MPIFDLTYRISLNDYLAYLSHQRSRMSYPSQRLIILWVLIFVNVVLGVTNSVSAFGDGKWAGAIIHTLVVAVSLFIIYGVVPWMLKLCYTRTKYGESDVHLLVEDGKVIVQQADLQKETKWSALVDVSRTSESIFLWLNNSQAFIVPLHAFSNPNEAEEFYRFSKEKIKEPSSDKDDFL